MLLQIFPGMLLTIFLLLPAARIYSQSTLDIGSLRGQIANESGEPIPGAIVRMKGETGAKAVESDSKGDFSVGFVTPGPYAVTISADRYQEQSQQAVLIMAKKTTQIKVILRLSGAVETNGPVPNWSISTTSVQTSINLSDAIKAFNAANRDVFQHPPVCECPGCYAQANIPVIENGHVHVSQSAMDTFGWRSLADIY